MFLAFAFAFPMVASHLNFCGLLFSLFFVMYDQVRTFKGHTNEKNFVGLTVNSEYIACGSETNEVFVYHKVSELNTLLYYTFSPN